MTAPQQPNTADTKHKSSSSNITTTTSNTKDSKEGDAKPAQQDQQQEPEDKLKKFEDEGVVIKAKLIGTELVIEPRGDKMCQTSLQRLKAIIKGTNSHKKRIVMKISYDGVKIFDEKTNELLHHHKVHEISYIASDETDSRTFGYVCDVPTNAHQFICFKSSGPAVAIMSQISALFDAVVEKKKLSSEAGDIIGATASNKAANINLFETSFDNNNDNKTNNNMSKLSSQDSGAIVESSIDALKFISADIDDVFDMSATSSTSAGFGRVVGLPSHHVGPTRPYGSSFDTSSLSDRNLSAAGVASRDHFMQKSQLQNSDSQRYMSSESFEYLNESGNGAQFSNSNSNQLDYFYMSSPPVMQQMDTERSYTANYPQTTQLQQHNVPPHQQHPHPQLTQQPQLPPHLQYNRKPFLPHAQQHQPQQQQQQHQLPQPPPAPARGAIPAPQNKARNISHAGVDMLNAPATSLPRPSAMRHPNRSLVYNHSSVSLGDVGSFTRLPSSAPAPGVGHMGFHSGGARGVGDSNEDRYAAFNDIDSLPSIFEASANVSGGIPSSHHGHNPNSAAGGLFGRDAMGMSASVSAQQAAVNKDVFAKLNPFDDDFFS